jgi:hypothetical protein
MDYHSHYNREYVDYNSLELASGLEFSRISTWIRILMLKFIHKARLYGEEEGGGETKFGAVSPIRQKPPEFIEVLLCL